MGKALSHFITITRHRHQVIKHAYKAGILWQGLLHDLSKYSITEFSVGASLYQGTRSPNEAEREEYGYSKAWLHHKGRNKHHFEYWTDYDYKTKQIFAIQMPRKYVVEMFCDRVAASKIYMKSDYTDSSSLEYFMRGKKARFINPTTSDQIEHLLRYLADNGEQKTFDYIKKWIKS